MSEEFLEATIPCKDCLVRAACHDLERSNEEFKDILKQFRSIGLFPPQINADQKNYRKCLIECWANLGYRFVNRISDGDKKDDPIFINPRLAMIIKEFAYLAQWIINSESWRYSKMYPFDQSEIEHKLKRIESMIKNARVA